MEGPGTAPKTVPDGEVRSAGRWVSEWDGADVHAVSVSTEDGANGLVVLPSVFCSDPVVVGNVHGDPEDAAVPGEKVVVQPGDWVNTAEESGLGLDRPGVPGSEAWARLAAPAEVASSRLGMLLLSAATGGLSEVVGEVVREPACAVLESGVAVMGGLRVRPRPAGVARPGPSGLVSSGVPAAPGPVTEPVKPGSPVPRGAAELEPLSPLVFSEKEDASGAKWVAAPAGETTVMSPVGLAEVVLGGEAPLLSDPDVGETDEGLRQATEERGDEDPAWPSVPRPKGDVVSVTVGRSVTGGLDVPAGDLEPAEAPVPPATDTS